MVPIALTREEMKERMIARRDGKLDEWKPEGEIKILPKQMSDWLEKNKGRMEKANKLPFWISDNRDKLPIEKRKR
jgi:hypothetical protein